MSQPLFYASQRDEQEVPVLLVRPGLRPRSNARGPVTVRQRARIRGAHGDAKPHAVSVSPCQRGSSGPVLPEYGVPTRRNGSHLDCLTRRGGVTDLAAALERVAAHGL